MHIQKIVKVAEEILFDIWFIYDFIYDEPMNGLDEQMVEKIRGVVLELKKRGKLIIITSHNREDIELLCDEVYKMRDGELEKIR